jgi:uncharacterized protein (TIGR03435 family)
VKDDRLYLYHMLERCRRITRFIRPGRETFLASEELQDAVIRNVEVIAALAGLLWVWGAVASAQSSGRPAPVFDVASIRPTDPRRGQIALQMGHGSFVGSDTVLGLVLKAYDLNPETVNGGPEWARSDWYDIAAKNQGGGGEGEIRLMLRALLADRFQLRSHFESATRSGYILTLDRKHTLSAKASKAGTESDGDGSIVRFSNGFTARGATMRSVCEFLSVGVLRQPVVDKTGLDGPYDFSLMYDDPMLTENAEVDRGQHGSIFTAFHQIGLVLSPSKAPVSVLHIDHLERPSPN